LLILDNPVQVTRKSLPPLLQAYINKVEALKETAEQMRSGGKLSEEIARTLYQMRRDIGVKYKDLTPADQPAKFHARNLEKYGDKFGPSIEYLRGQGCNRVSARADCLRNKGDRRG